MPYDVAAGYVCFHSESHTPKQNWVMLKMKAEYSPKSSEQSHYTTLCKSPTVQHLNIITHSGILKYKFKITLEHFLVSFPVLINLYF